MVLNYLSILVIIALCAAFSLWSSVSEAKVKYMPRRDKSIKNMEEKGYRVSKRWDCNALSFFVDKHKRVLCFLVMSWRKDTVYDIVIDDIKNIKIETMGISKRSKMKTLITQVCLNIETTKGNYVLRTLYVKGLGLRPTSPHVQYALKCAEEICEYVNNLKK